MGQFEKGQSGNPGGRPRGAVSIVNILLKKLRTKPVGKDKRYVEAIVDQLLDLALYAREHKTRLGAILAIVERVDGKVPDKLEASGPGGKEIIFRVVRD